MIGWDSVETASNEADGLVEIDQINVTVSHAHWTTGIIIIILFNMFLILINYLHNFLDVAHFFT